MRSAGLAKALNIMNKNGVAVDVVVKSSDVDHEHLFQWFYRLITSVFMSKLCSVFRDPFCVLKYIMLRERELYVMISSVKIVKC